MYCPGKYCLDREKCESIGGYVATPRSIFACGKCGAWLSVHKVAFTLQKHVKTTKTDKTRFFFSRKRWTLYPTNNYLFLSHFQSTKNRKKEMCVDNKVRETIGDVYCPTCRNEKCVYLSTKKTTSFYDCKKCKACCHVLNIPFRDQKPTILLFGVDGTHCFARKTSRDYEKEKPSPFWRNFSANQSHAHTNLNQKRVNRVQIWNKRICFLLANDLSNIFVFSNDFIQFQSTVNQSNLHPTYTKSSWSSQSPLTKSSALSILDPALLLLQ